MIAIDTNILVYAFDLVYPNKRKVCKEILLDIFDGGKVGVVTNQILSEFVFAVTKKIEKPISNKEAKIIVEAIMSSRNWMVLNYTANTLLNAIESPHPFWDSLIIQTLKENNVNKIITENIRDFRGSGINVINPLN